MSETTIETDGSGRKEFAASILHEKNPLTARVMVNRIWQHLFGTGIVETVDNFGLQGKLPTHPELLDYLAIRFRKDDWSIKKMIRLIVLSETFRRSVSTGKEQAAADPANIYLARFPVRRLEAEAIRDGLLAVSGRLDSTMFGPSIPVYLSSFMNGAGKPAESGPLDGAGRRSIYQEIRRNFLEPMMLTFDRPIPFSTFGKRNVTNVPAQSLIMMNDPFVVQQAELLAKEVLTHKNATVEQRIQRIYQKALSRTATEEETLQGKSFLAKLAAINKVDAEMGLNHISIWKDYCHSIFNLKEFIFLT